MHIIFCGALYLIYRLFSVAEEHPRTTFGFCIDSNQLVDIHELVQAAKVHSLPGLGVSMSRDELLRELRGNQLQSGAPPAAIGGGDCMQHYMLRV